MRIVLLHQAPDPHRPDERDVLVQCEALAAALAAAGHEPSALACDLDLAALRTELGRRAPDLVFNLVESLAGSGRLLHLAPALLDALAIPYTGAPAEAVLLTSHKLLAKRWLRAGGLPTPDWFEDAPGAEPPRVGRWIVKSLWEDASLGLGDDSVVDAAAQDLRAALRERAPALGGEAFAERFVEGRELNLALLAKGDDVELLPPAEIRFASWPAAKPRLVGYAAKWEEDSFEALHTPRHFDFEPADRALLARLAALARRVWTGFGLAGYARVDFRVDAAGRPFVLEANANPCLSPDAGFAAAAARANLDLREVALRIVAAARRRGARRRQESPCSG